MVSKRELEDEVTALRDQLTGAATDVAEAGLAAVGEARKAVEARLTEGKEHLRALAEVPGMAMEEMKGVGERLLGEVRDMPQKKPLMTLVGIFVLGVVVGRMSRK